MFGGQSFLGQDVLSTQVHLRSNNFYLWARCDFFVEWGWDTQFSSRGSVVKKVFTCCTKSFHERLAPLGRFEQDHDLAIAFCCVLIVKSELLEKRRVFGLMLVVHHLLCLRRVDCLPKRLFDILALILGCLLCSCNTPGRGSVVRGRLQCS